MSAEYTPCKVCLVEGYLGAGKTTLLNKVLAQPNGHRIAVIVNDIGEINIDARLIEKSGGGVTMQDGDLIPLTNGCICCTLSEDLAQQLSDLACSNKYDYIVIEASGICEPMPIAQTITMMSEATKRQGMPEIVHVDNIVAVVDAARLKDEFSCGEVLREVPEDEEDLASLLI
ncbi:MAG: GTP-binding protein, partial [Clostridia bacterium]|nr:GTP-binding protein [Clostridia bacterium]